MQQAIFCANPRRRHRASPLRLALVVLAPPAALLLLLLIADRLAGVFS